ncbi:hypothetical protein [Methylorubrum extorquens]|uniref:hypothetical protein n=1 Tax=Methylorubrum extorquens TaxID=408 RepID=UPI000158F396|nr:hypothetical protein [Methylorubrum extorquens]ABY29567.1 conserved hypothetical protein [Methylorubrum extorquens PA1]KQP88825.1 hypothetical protein ASF55_05440 [Methylobacterium sp. Leaf119]WIU40890.1 hypothetical protein KQ926_06170 [Methylorubrum extorquens]
MSAPAWADDLGRELCRALSGAVERTAPDGDPVFLASYEPGPDEKEVPPPLRSTAFSYDNALAATALAACGDLRRARQIGEAFLVAIESDRTFEDGRIRNAYRAGPVRARPVLLPGWWDAANKRWSEDRYQDGTATGNVAWVGLALLNLRDATQDPRFEKGATRLAAWIRARTARHNGPGFTGGLDGYDPDQASLSWASTEHNLDIVALGMRLGKPDDRAMAASARTFLDAAFDERAGCFRMGTDTEGHMRGIEAVALDTQLWPLLGVVDPPEAWRRSLSCATTRLGVPGGFDFNDDRDGLWVEGTAQAALAYRSVQNEATAGELLQTLSGQRAPSGWLYASREARLTTGLRIGPASTQDDFFYFRRPHLGATAWAALAALGHNPFTGGRVQ